jgi:hypothetical protein
MGVGSTEHMESSIRGVKWLFILKVLIRIVLLFLYLSRLWNNMGTIRVT